MTIFDNFCVWLRSFCIDRQIIFLLVLEDSDWLLDITACYHGNDCDLRNVSAEEKKKKTIALHWEFPSLQGSGHCTVLHSKYMVMASHIFIICLCFTKSYIIEHVISKHKRISRQVNRRQWNDITLHFEKNLQLNLSVNHAV